MDDSVVVITGTGIVCSIGMSVSEVWDALLSGKHGIHQIGGYDVSGFACQIAAQVHGLDPSKLNIHPRQSRIMNKHSYMLMKCAHEAYQQAGLQTASITGDEIGFFAGMGMVDYEVEDLLPAVFKSMDTQGNLNYDSFFSQGYQEIYPLWPLSMLNNISFCQVAISLGLRGENTVFSPHADACVQAIAEAVATLQNKKAKAALAGGVSEKVSPLSLARNHLTKTAACQPFGTDRKSGILGEGCGVLALELKSSADARGISYKAAITGYGFAFGVKDGSCAPTAEAIQRSMRNAMKMAGKKPEDIDLVIANGDGTDAGNKNEITAILRVFSDCADKIHVFSSKGAVGHLFAGAPAVDTIIGINIMEQGVIPASTDIDLSEKNIAFNRVNAEPLSATIKRMMVNCQSYEGQCASLIIEKVD